MLKTRTWVAQYRDGQGMVRNVTTRDRDRQATRQVLAQALKRVEQTKAGIMTAQQARPIPHYPRAWNRLQLERPLSWSSGRESIARHRYQGGLLVTDCPRQLTFGFYHDRQLVADLMGGQISSDTGLLAVRELDGKLGWLAEEKAARAPAGGLRYSSLDLTMNVYTDPTLLDVAGALEAPPVLALSNRGRAGLRAMHANSRQPADNGLAGYLSICP